MRGFAYTHWRASPLNRELRGVTHSACLTVPGRIDAQSRDCPTCADGGYRHQVDLVGLRAVHTECVDLTFVSDPSGVMAADAVQPKLDPAVTEATRLALDANERAILVVDDQVISRRGRDRSEEFAAGAHKRRRNLHLRHIADTRGVFQTHLR